MSKRPILPADGLLPDPYGAHEMPIYQTSTFTFERAADAAARFAGEAPGFVYTRIGNPTVARWEEKVAALESEGTGKEAAALAFGSGMGAVTAAVLACVEQGDHVVAVRPLYGGTTELFLEVLPRYGVTVTQVCAHDLPKGLEAAARKPRTRLVVVETPANPTLDIVDLAHAASVAKAAGARLLVDNTFATPVLQRPLGFGADLVVHSSTKYLGGHGTVVGGVVVSPDRELLAGRINQMKKVLGSVPSPFDAWLLLQGVKTLRLRVERESATARRLAAELAQHKLVEWVRYPGLVDDPGHEIASRQMFGFGAMIAFGIRGGTEVGRRFLDALTICRRAVSLGCTDTLIEHPASMTHAHLSAEELAAAGITDGLIRLSVGLESPEDLERDLLGALDRASRPPRGSAAPSRSPRAGSRRAASLRTSRS
jgi:methionine-gamma-lyase